MRIFQHFVYLVVRIIIIIFRIKINEPSLKLPRNEKGYVIAVNHISKLDPYISTGSLSLGNYMRLRLFRFMTVNRYMVGFTGIILRLSGAYPYKALNDEPFGLEASRLFLSKGQSVVIFPEGGIKRPGSQLRIHSGVSVLAKEQGVKVLPIHIKVRNQTKPNKIFNNVNIIIGSPFDGGKMSAEEIMNRVYEL
jgi:1-acyl-sn-glycerol-3-phosphate acyltransferase